MGRLNQSIAVPKAHGGLGTYSMSQMTGIIAAGLAANADLFSFRWAPTDTTKKAVIRKVEVQAAVSTTYFAAGVPLQLAAFKASGWSAADSGGTALTLAALGKRDAGMGSTLVQAGDIRIASTAGLTAGTRTLEGTAIGHAISGAPITGSLSGQIFAPGTRLLDVNSDRGEYPLILTSQEGFVVRAVATPGTGTWSLAVAVTWEEVSAFPYT